jgi:hypothetical protein
MDLPRARLRAATGQHGDRRRRRLDLPDQRLREILRAARHEAGNQRLPRRILRAEHGCVRERRRTGGTVDLATRVHALIGDDHCQSMAACGNRRGHPRWPRADDQEIARCFVLYVAT